MGVNLSFIICVHFYLPGGFVKLQTNNAFDPPLINPALLDSDFDIFAMRETIKAAQRFFAAPAWKGFVLAPAGGLANATTDDLLDNFIRGTAFSASHPVGTAAMSTKDANFGVVNPDLLVKGVSGLRIVDASIMASGRSWWSGNLLIFASGSSHLLLAGTHKHLHTLLQSGVQI